jgi:hypothetical protein
MKIRNSNGCHIVFPHARDWICSLDKFVATWNAWAETFYPNLEVNTLAIPRRHTRANLCSILGFGLAPCLDVLCRYLVPVTYSNTMQASGEFMVENARWIAHGEALSPAGRVVQGAILTEDSRRKFAMLTGAVRAELQRSARELSVAARDGRLP